jgi:asparagine synthase (glutamine-hydrolysing)
MDSSAVVCVARNLMQRGDFRGPLHTLSLTYKHVSLADERKYIDMVVQQGGPLEPHYLEADAAVDFSWFNGEVPVHDEPYAALNQLAMFNLQIRKAHEVGATTILTGLGEEFVMESPRVHAADLLKRGRWLAAIKETQRWAIAGNVSLWSALRRSAIEPIFPTLMQDGIGIRLRRGYARWPKLGQFSIRPWVESNFAGRYEMWRKSRTLLRRLTSGSLERAIKMFELHVSVGDWSSTNLAAPLGMRISHPFFDPRLIKLCLALPRAVKEVPGMPKPLLQTAMRDVLPEPIRTRRFKQGFNGVRCKGLTQHLPALEHMIRESRIRDLGIFNVEKLVEMLRQHAAGVGNAEAAGHLNSTLALIAWFDQFERPRPSLPATDQYSLSIPAVGAAV